MDQKEILAKIKTAQINQALGFFILFFGIIVALAMFFTDDTHIQMMTDLVAGGVLILIGGGMMLKSHSTIKKYKPKLNKQEN